VGSNPTPRTYSEPTVLNLPLFNFVLWLMKKGNRESTVKRKLRYLKQFKGFSLEEMMAQVLAKNWLKE